MGCLELNCRAHPDVAFHLLKLRLPFFHGLRVSIYHITSGLGDGLQLLLSLVAGTGLPHLCLHVRSSVVSIPRPLCDSGRFVLITLTT